MYNPTVLDTDCAACCQTRQANVVEKHAGWQQVAHGLTVSIGGISACSGSSSSTSIISDQSSASSCYCLRLQLKTATCGGRRVAVVIRRVYRRPRRPPALQKLHHDTARQKLFVPHVV